MMGADAPMVKNGRTADCAFLPYGGCSCHNDKAARRRAKRGAKRAGDRQWQNETETER